jgi:hypothetical protein
MGLLRDNLYRAYVCDRFHQVGNAAVLPDQDF